jgi:hypothetical protein
VPLTPDPERAEPARRDPARPGPLHPDDEHPPILGTWRRLYALVLLALAAEIALFWAFTRAFS